MAETLTLCLVSPEARFLTEEVELAVIPGDEGDFGVLPHHTALIASLRPGLLQTYSAGSVKHQLFVSGGFANVNERGCTILAEECVFIQDLDRHQLEEQLSELREDLKIDRTPQERAQHAYAYSLLQAKLEVLQRLGR